MTKATILKVGQVIDGVASDWHVDCGAGQEGVPGVSYGIGSEQPPTLGGYTIGELALIAEAHAATA